MSKFYSDLISRKEAADYLGIKTSTLNAWASEKKIDLKYTKIGRLAKYRIMDLNKFIEDRTICNS